MEEDLDITEKKIISATFQLLKEEGIQKATTKKIAKIAEVNEVTIFRKFKNKKTLVERTKDYYMHKLVTKLEEIFDFEPDEEIDEYIPDKFRKLLELPEEEFSVMKLAMEEVRDIPDRKHLISQITSAILLKIEEFFEIQIEKGKVRDLPPTALSIMVFSIIFQSVVLWKVYDENNEIENKDYSESIIDALINGIKA